MHPQLISCNLYSLLYPSVITVYYICNRKPLYPCPCFHALQIAIMTSFAMMIATANIKKRVGGLAGGRWS